MSKAKNKLPFVTTLQAARQLRCHVSTIQKAAVRLGVGRKLPGGETSPFVFAPEEIEILRAEINSRPGSYRGLRNRILSLLAKGQRPTDIAAKLGCTASYVYRLAASNNLSPPQEK